MMYRNYNMIVYCLFVKIKNEMKRKENILKY